MKARPILFSAPMIRALLEGRKTQTRRMIRLKTGDTFDEKALAGAIQEWRPVFDKVAGRVVAKEAVLIKCPYGNPGDLLWVRETWGPCGTENAGETIAIFRATEPDELGEIHWRPSIYMPRWASRLTLELTEVRVERLQEISEVDAVAEGIEPVHMGAGELCGFANYQYVGEGMGYFAEDPVSSYASLWDSINGFGSWDANPWVWVLCFQVHQQNIDDFIKSREAA